MIPASLLATIPTDARYEQRPDGFAFAFPSGWTRLRVRERNVPVRAARQVFEAVRLGLGLSTSGHATTIEDRVTREGEHAAIMELVEGERRCTFGITYGDHFYRIVVGRTDDAARAPSIAEAARRFTLELSLGLASLRRRRFRYTPPPGWSAVSRHGLITEWFAPGFPTDRALLTVMSARPFMDTPSSATERNLHEMTWGGYQRETLEGPAVVLVSDHLQGVAWKLVGAWSDGARTHTDVVILNDGTFVYVLRLDHDGSRTEEHRATFDAVVRSIRPIPTAHTTMVAATGSSLGVD